MPTGTILKIILLVMEFIQKLTDKYRDQGLINEGYDKALAEANAKMLRKSAYAKKVADQFNNLTDSDTDKFLRDLEPK